MSAHKPTTNFESTLKQLKSYCSEPIVNDRDRAGIIQGFEFTFEQSWLSIQKILGKMQVLAPSPKQAYVEAMKQGWISASDETLWVQMIKDRNQTSHTYKQDLANEVLGRIQTQYIPAFEKLLTKLESLHTV
jgi:nucleotidyltransferase substrate binding protein (TIGR01987 family)